MASLHVLMDRSGQTDAWLTKLFTCVGERVGESGKQVGSMDEESQVRGCYNRTCFSLFFSFFFNSVCFKITNAP